MTELKDQLSLLGRKRPNISRIMLPKYWNPSITSILRRLLGTFQLSEFTSLCPHNGTTGFCRKYVSVTCPMWRWWRARALSYICLASTNHGVLFHEDCVNIILNSIRLMDPKYIKVTGILPRRYFDLSVCQLWSPRNKIWRDGCPAVDESWIGGGLFMVIGPADSSMVVNAFIVQRSDG